MLKDKPKHIVNDVCWEIYPNNPNPLRGTWEEIRDEANKRFPNKNWEPYPYGYHYGYSDQSPLCIVYYYTLEEFTDDPFFLKDRNVRRALKYHFGIPGWRGRTSSLRLLMLLDDFRQKVRIAQIKEKMRENA